MAGELLFKPRNGRTVRLTRLIEDCCELPAEDTADTIIVFDAFTTFSAEANMQDGQTAFELKANGDICLNEQDDDLLQNLSVHLTMCQVSPSAVSALTGWPLAYDADGKAVGFDFMEGASGVRTALEVWSAVAGVDCGLGARYGYGVFPCTGSWALSDAIEWAGVDTISSITLTGRTNGHHGWFNGPYPVQLDNGGDAGPMLDAMQTGAHGRIMVTDVAPPPLTDGLVVASAANLYLFGPDSI